MVSTLGRLEGIVHYAAIAPQWESQTMVQEVRHDEPQYSCVVPVESITGNKDEEIVTLGVSAEDATYQAEQLLTSSYKCSKTEIDTLMQQASIEAIAPWCSPHKQPDKSF